MEVKRKGLIYEHGEAVRVREVIVVASPAALHPVKSVILEHGRDVELIVDDIFLLLFTRRNSLGVDFLVYRFILAAELH